MKLSEESESTITQLSIIVIFGILIGIGTASWSLGFAGALAMMMFIFRT